MALIAKWDFENVYTDSSGNGLDLTATGSVPFAAGYDGQCVDLTVSGANYLSRVDNSLLKPTKLTIDCYVNMHIACTPYASLAVKSNGSWNKGYGLTMGTDAGPEGTTGKTVWFWINIYTSGSSRVHYQLPNYDTWYHIVATYDLTNITLYCDGVQQAQLGFSTAIDHDTSDFKMGKIFGAQLNGYIDKARLYDDGLYPSVATGGNVYMDGGLGDSSILMGGE